MTRYSIRFSLCVGALLLGLGSGLCAQTYPSAPIKLVVAFAPGTGSDILGRILASKLSDQLGSPVAVENRAGAGGIVGTQSVVKAAPDGYTLTLGTNATLITSPLLSQSHSYRVDKDLLPIGGVARTPMVVVTHVQAEAPKSLQELILRGKEKNSSFSSAGVGTIGHLTSEVLVKKLNLESNHVPYKGSGQSLTDVARGEILFSTDTPPAVLPLIRGGKLRPLMVTGERRLQVLPDVPTLQELGFPGVNLGVWWALMAPVGTPSAVVDRLGSE